MPQRNRVTPYGDIIATPLRGAWMGNRGSIHRGHDIVRPFATRRWITCALEYKGWVAPQWKPGRWTALFFYDEALAFAAGHRPCALCRRPAYLQYLAAIDVPGADAVDVKLHEQRWDGGRKRTHPIPWRGLPAGAYVAFDSVPHVVLEDALRPWDARSGYGARVARPRAGDSVVLTPPLTLRAFANGYTPQISG